MSDWSVDLNEFFSFLQMLWSAIPLPIMTLLGVLAMFSVLASFHGKFGGDNH